MQEPAYPAYRQARRARRKIRDDHHDPLEAILFLEPVRLFKFPPKFFNGQRETGFLKCLATLSLHL
jgi:hypothetical protein